MKKLLGLAMLVLVLVGCQNDATVENMKDVQEVHGMDYVVYELSNTVFLIHCDDVMDAFENNENLAEVHSYNKTLDGIQINFLDGSGYWIEK